MKLRASGYWVTGDECPECGGLLWAQESRDDRGVSTDIRCEDCGYSDQAWYDTLDLPEGA